MNNVYYKTIFGDIYKKTNNPEIYIKVSPWDNDEDRRLSFSTIVEMVNNGQASKLNKNKAREELNTIWREAKRHWVYNGNYYKSEGTVCNTGGKQPTYTWKHKYTNQYTGKEFECEYTWKLCMFQGHIYWYQITQYYPQVQLETFNGIDVDPFYSDYVRWTNIKNLKPIFKKNYSGKWERI